MQPKLNDLVPAISQRALLPLIFEQKFRCAVLLHRHFWRWSLRLDFKRRPYFSTR